MSDIQAQCWICPHCHEDRHHEPRDAYCLKGQIDQARHIITDLIHFCEQPEIVAATDGAFDPDAAIQAGKRFLGGGDG